MFVLAEITTVSLILIAISVSASLAGYLLKRKPSLKQAEQRPTTLASRGSYESPLWGTRLVAPLFAWWGERVVEESSGGGGKGGGIGGKGGGGNQTYFESACHDCGVGPFTALVSIRENNKQVWNGRLTPENTPSGSHVDTDVGGFYLWWGEKDQPVDTWLGDANRLGILSRWPYAVKVNWVKKELGPTANWPEILYEFERIGQGRRLAGSLPSITVPGEASPRGSNAAHIIYEVMTGKFPHGCGIDPADIDIAALERLGMVLQNDLIGTNYNPRDGETGASFLQKLMNELGFLMPYVNGLISFRAVRPDPLAQVPEITDGMLAKPLPQTDVWQTDRAADAPTFIFSSKDFNYKDDDVGMPDDALASTREGVRKQEDVRLETVTDLASAVRSADRMQLSRTIAADPIRFVMTHAARLLFPGDVVRRDPWGQLLIMSRKPDQKSGRVDISCTPNIFSAYSNFATSGTGTTSLSPKPAPDRMVKIVELPFPLAGDTVTIGALRVRASTVTGPAKVHASLDGKTYTEIGKQPAWCSAGTLTRPLDADGLTIEEEGPILAAINTDVANTPDLGTDDSLWLGGELLLFIDDEICFVRNLTAIGDALWQPNGLVRGRMGTVKAAHPVGTPVFIIRRGKLNVLKGSMLAKNKTVLVKVQPAGTDISKITPVAVALQGRARAPYPVSNLGPITYTSGTNANIDWTYALRDSKHEGAGDQGYGDPVDTNFAREGSFEVTIYSTATGGKVRTVTVNSNTTHPSLGGHGFAYTPSMRLNDLGNSNPNSFRVQVVNKLNGFTSPPISTVVTKV